MNATRHGRVSLAPFLRRLTPAHACRLLLCLTLLTSALAAARSASAQGEVMIVLNPATEGLPYEAQVVNPTGTNSPFKWEVLEGDAPKGLSFNKVTGKLEGAATGPRAEPYRFRVRVTDSSNPPRVAEQWMSITIEPLPLIVQSGFGTAPVPTSTPTAKQRAAEFVLTTSTSDEETIALTEQFAEAPPFPAPTPDTDPKNLTRLQEMISKSIGTKTENFHVGDYCVMHVIEWKPLSGENKTEPKREIWALFKSRAPEADEGGVPPGNIVWEPVEDKKNKELFDTRIFGRKRVAVLLVHLNTPSEWDVKYKVAVNQKIPTPIQHVLDLVASINPSLVPPDEKKPKTKNIWGARMMLIKYESSELVVKVNAVTLNGETPVEQSKEHSKTFVNEGKYHWDVSVGLPVKSVRELTFKSDGGRVFAQAKEKQSVYGFLDIYPWAVDLKGDSYLTKPHFVFGVPMASKPLHRPFVGIGSGVFKSPIKFNFFAGIVFIRERVPTTLGEGSAATTGQLEADLRTRWVRKGMFGISLPVSQIKDAIKK